MYGRFLVASDTFCFISAGMTATFHHHLPLDLSHKCGFFLILSKRAHFHVNIFEGNSLLCQASLHFDFLSMSIFPENEVSRRSSHCSCRASVGRHFLAWLFALSLKRMTCHCVAKENVRLVSLLSEESPQQLPQNPRPGPLS